MLKQRMLTAAILIPLVLAAIYFLPQSYFFLIGSIIVALAAWEWCTLANFNDLKIKIVYVIITVLLCALIWCLPFELFTLCGALLWVAFIIALCRYPKGSDFWRHSAWLRAFCGVSALITFLASLMVLKIATPVYIFILLAIVWIMDSAAYFAGRLWGKKPMAPKISPKKTMEGLVSALLVVIILSLPLVLWVNPYKHASWAWFFLILITAAVSVLGDLVESMAKRLYDVKDSGHLLPGHGGILDRIDSLLAATVCFALGQMLLS
jgi:phosphatidate cytidylyltransferase